MNIFGFHICQDEIYAFVLGLDYIRPLALWLGVQATKLGKK